MQAASQALVVVVAALVDDCLWNALQTSVLQAPVNTWACSWPKKHVK